MFSFLSLWLPILLSAVVVFVISSLIHMVFKWHASDYGRLANEDAVREAIRAGNPAPGRYVMPHCADMKDMAGETLQQKYREGPVGHMTIGPNGVPNMGKYVVSLEPGRRGGGGLHRGGDFQPQPHAGTRRGQAGGRRHLRRLRLRHDHGVHLDDAPVVCVGEVSPRRRAVCHRLRPGVLLAVAVSEEKPET
jgi:hypothetical protein